MSKYYNQNSKYVDKINSNYNDINNYINTEFFFDPNIWGSHYWFFLHTISLIYPDYPNTIIKKKYYEFIQNLPIFIPVKEISVEFSRLLDKYPVEPYLENKKSLINWVHFIHNKINEQLEKPKINITDFYKIYYDQYKTQTEKILNYKMWREKIIYFLLIGIIVGCIYYLY